VLNERRRKITKYLQSLRETSKIDEKKYFSSRGHDEHDFDIAFLLVYHRFFTSNIFDWPYGAA
jgi:hypothetical protein